MQMESVVEPIRNNEKTIDREKTCPLLLRVFCNNGGFNHPEDYANGTFPPGELQIYTWMDATLGEISRLVREVNPDARRTGTLLEFGLMEPEGRRLRRRPIGKTIVGLKSNDDLRTLTHCRFTIGDYMDIAITPQSRVIPMDRPRRRF